MALLWSDEDKILCTILGTWARSHNLRILHPLERNTSHGAYAWYPLGSCNSLEQEKYLSLSNTGIDHLGSVLCSMIRNGYIKFGQRYKICTGRGNLIKPEKEMIACYFLEGIIYATFPMS